MNSLLAPGPWHFTAEDHVVRDVNGAPIAIVLARHPRVHAEIIASLPAKVRAIEDAKDILIRELRDKLETIEFDEREQDALDEEIVELRASVSGLMGELELANLRIADLEKSLREAELGLARKSD